jgi:hypothetical protein
MSIVIRMRFDGKVFIPEEPVDMPLNEPLDFEYKPPEPKLAPEEIAKRRAAIKRLASMAIPGLVLSDFALSRESIYFPPRGL